MSRPHVRTLALTALTVLVLAACATDTLDPTTPSVTAPVATTTPPGDTGLTDGEYFAWVSGPVGDGFVLDPALLLSGEEAREAAVADGVIAEGEDLPNDVYIDDPEDETFVVAPAGDATYSAVLFADGTPTEAEVTYDELASILSGADPDVYGVVEGVLPATVTIDGGVITSVTQVYLP